MMNLPHTQKFTNRFATPSHPAHDEPSPPHTPQSSFTNPLFATPSHPAHDELSPPYATHHSLIH